MAKAREDSQVSGLEVRQQKLPLSWRQDGTPKTATPPPEAPLPPPPDDADAAAAAAEPPPARAATAAPAVPPPEPVPPESAPSGDALDRVATERVPEPPAASAMEAADAEDDADDDAGGSPAGLPAASGPGVGELLLAARADSGYSIEEVSGRTRIPRDVIEHLERSAHDELPSEYYCRSHIEKLCAQYNVDAAPILERFHATVVAQRGETARLAGLQAVTSDSESGSRISYVLPGPGAATRKPRSLSLTGAIVSAVIGLFLIMVLAAIIALHVHNRRADDPAPVTPAAGTGAPTAAAAAAAVGGADAPVPLQDFIVPEQLNAYELPIPDR